MKMKAVLMPVTGKAANTFERVLNKPSIGKKLSAQQRELIAKSIQLNSKHGRKTSVSKIK